MLLLPNVGACTVITDSGHYTYIDSPQGVIRQLFYPETKVDDTHSIINPIRKEVYVLINPPLTDIYCQLLTQAHIKVIPINYKNPNEVFKGGNKWKD